MVTFSGTWSPSYVEVRFRLVASTGSATSMGTGISSGESGSLPAAFDSTYVIYAQAIEEDISGLLNITFSD